VKILEVGGLKFDGIFAGQTHSSTFQRHTSFELKAMSVALRVSAPTAADVAVYPPGASYGPRLMRDYEFVWMIEGDAEYSANGRTAAAPQGSMVLCRRGERDFFRWDPKRRTRHGYFHFQIQRMPGDWPAPGEWPSVRLLDEGDVLRPLFRHLLTWRGDAALARLTVAHLLTCFITGQIATDDAPRPPLAEPIERTLAYIRARLDKDAAAPLGFAQLVSASGITANHLCRLFKKTTGRTPAQTVRMAKLDRIAPLILHSNFGLKEIARMYDFSSPYHLSKVFKECYGVSPAQVRKLSMMGQAPALPRLLG
jgi:AraC-like DNA-binding protein